MPVSHAEVTQDQLQQSSVLTAARRGEPVEAYFGTDIPATPVQ